MLALCEAFPGPIIPLLVDADLQGHPQHYPQLQR